MEPLISADVAVLIATTVPSHAQQDGPVPVGTVKELFEFKASALAG